MSEYPLDLRNANLLAIQLMKEKFPNIEVGYSDHTIGNEAAITAVALGATIIEKHFTLNKKAKGPDHASSIEPEELKQLVEGANAIFEARNEKKKNT